MGIHEAIVSEYIEALIKEERIKEVVHRGVKFYQT
jgi:thiamine biosynthesis protein ThiC